MKKKLIIVFVLVLAVGGFAAKTILLKPKPIKLKVAGAVYVMPKQFTLNLADGRYATLTAALILAPTQSDGSTAAGGGASSDAVVGTLPEEAVIRDIITNVVTGSSGSTLTSVTGRETMKHKILKAISTQTDDKISGVLFTDVAVQ
jgi:flagellar basal body-associated protein FliL